LLIEHALDRVGLVIPVGAFGRAVYQAAWKAFRDETGIAVVIDGAACFEIATSSPNRTFGDIPVAISFHATKSFGVGEGGCVVTRDLNLATRVVRAINFGFFGSRDCQSPNINGKLSEYHAAVGLAELDGWAEKSHALLSVAEGYRSALKGTSLLERFLAAPQVASCYALIRCETATDAQRLERALAGNGIGFRRWYGAGLHLHSYHAGLEREALPVTSVAQISGKRLRFRLLDHGGAFRIASQKHPIVGDDVAFPTKPLITFHGHEVSLSSAGSNRRMRANGVK